MFNPSFDPFEELMLHQQRIQQQQLTINRLVSAHNQVDSILVDLTQQHQQLVNFNKDLKHQVELMRMEINELRRFLNIHQ
jgi:hypothetical protein